MLLRFNKELKAAIISMFKEKKKPVYKSIGKYDNNELSRSQFKNWDYENKPNKSWGWKVQFAEMKISPEWLNSRLETAAKITSKLERR